MSVKAALRVAFISACGPAPGSPQAPGEMQTKSPVLRPGFFVFQAVSAAISVAFARRFGSRSGLGVLRTASVSI
jgi:hypothetical protein